MVVFAKIRQAFTAVVGEVTHEAGVIVAVTEGEAKAIAHKVEFLAEDLARELHLTKGHALAVSPTVAATAGAVLNVTASPAPAADPAPKAPADTAPAAAAPVPAGDAAPAPAGAQEAADAPAAASTGTQAAVDAGAASTGGAAA